MADESRDDVVEMGGRRVLPPGGHLIPPGLRPSRVAGVLAAVTLVIGLAAGYAAGDRNARSTTAAPEPTVTVTATATAQPTMLAGSAFSFGGAQALTAIPGQACAVQLGHRLQLGVLVKNQTSQPITLRGVRTQLPLGGLKQVSHTWTPCGTLAGGYIQDPAVLPAGASTWMSVTFQVQVGCPGPYPVQFNIEYLAQQGAAATVNIGGFSDLSNVPYSGCPPVPTSP